MALLTHIRADISFVAKTDDCAFAFGFLVGPSRSPLHRVAQEYVIEIPALHCAFGEMKPDLFSLDGFAGHFFLLVVGNSFSNASTAHIRMQVREGFSLV